MEEENKIPTTSESNPNGDDQVNASDLEDDGQQTPPASTAEDGNSGDGAKQHTSEDGQKTQPKQGRKTDAQYAEERRQRKAREEAKQKAREEEIRRQAVFEVKSGQVTAEELKELDLDKVEDEDQLFLVESLRKAKADGVENPQAEAYRALFKKQTAGKGEAKAKAEAEKAEKEKITALVAEDQKNFKAKYGKTTADVLENEPEFKELFGNSLQPGNFTSLYTAYTALKKNQSDTAKKQGSFPTGASGDSQGNGQTETDDEFKKRWIAEHGRW